MGVKACARPRGDRDTDALLFTVIRGGAQRISHRIGRGPRAGRGADPRASDVFAPPANVWSPARVEEVAREAKERHRCCSKNETMSENANTPRPARPPFDSGFVCEGSHVRARPDTAPSSSRDTSLTEGPATARETMAERTARIENKMALATLVLRKLSPLDARARVLASALLRRDEILIDAVLARMEDEIVRLVPTR